MKKLRRTFSMILSLVLLAAMSVTTFAADSVPEVTFDANTEVFTYDNVSVYATGDGTEFPDLFTQFKNAIPGDEFEQEVLVNVENVEDCTVNLYLYSKNSNVDYDTLMESVLFAVYYEGEEISAGTLSDGIVLGSFTADATMDITVEFSIPLTVGNEIAGLYGTIDWVFVAEIIEDEIVEDVVEADTPDTGDYADPVLWLSLAAIALAGVGVVYYKRSQMSKRQDKI